MKICYTPHRFAEQQKKLIKTVNAVVDDFQAQGYVLTLRQLYYRLVSANVIANTIQQYKGLSSLVSIARLAGDIDWDAIEDRTRNLKGLRHWDDPSDGIDWLQRQYSIDKWANQDCRIEVWIEKEALAGVFERACVEQDVPFFCCRGYNSQSEMWGAAMRLKRYEDDHEQEPVILHFGDHDPSGIDMTRDVADRLATFGVNLTMERLALNIDQVRRHNLPPNPARKTDARYKAYMAKFGKESWELDALPPATLHKMVTDAIVARRDEERWKRSLALEKRERAQLQKVSRKWAVAVAACK